MGHNLSGGQKSRISLARALYRKHAAIVMIDCTLGSLDAKVSKKVMERAVFDLCRDKLVIFVTHDLDHAAQMDKVVYLSGDQAPAQILSAPQFQEHIDQLRGKLGRSVAAEKGEENEDEAAKAGSAEEEEEAPDAPAEVQQVIKEEANEVGHVTWTDVKDYFSYAPGGLWGVLLVFIMHAIINGATMAVSLYLAFSLTQRFTWAEGLSEEDKAAAARQYNLVLMGIIALALGSAFIGKWISVKVFMTISKRLHNTLVHRVVRTGIDFFEENTQGRILNRFSKDTATMDNVVFGFLEMTDYIVKCLFALAVVVVMSPWIVIIAIFSFFYLLQIRRTNLVVSRDTIRLKYSLMSPVNSLVQDAVNGLPTLRCLDQLPYFQRLLYTSMDQQTTAHITSNGGNRWASVRIDSQAYILATAFAFVAMFLADSDRTPAELAMTAVGLQMAIDITRQIDFAIRWSTSFEMQLLSIQRLLEYAKLEPEAADRSIKPLTDDHQFTGRIDFEGVDMRYRPDLQPALKDLAFTVRAGERVAVVGRTGAGKSSLSQLLLGFRVADKGRVAFDDQDLGQLDLDVLRQQINVVLQHPFVVATDTIRENLDPRGQFSDAELEQALADAAFERQQVLSKEDGAPSAGRAGSLAVRELELDSLATDLSAGQQQLLTLAYSLLQKDCRVTLLDEPTAQVDYHSQQRALQSIYSMAAAQRMTVMMVAHRLETAVTYSDKVLVMDAGTVAEFDQSYKLLVKQEGDSTVTSDSLFASMVRSLTLEQQGRILLIAKENYEKTLNPE